MLYDFERLYIWRKTRRFRSPVDVLIVLPKEVDIPSMIEFWQGPGREAFPDFLKYVEWFGGRRAEDEDLLLIDLEAVVNKASWAWLTREVDTKTIGVKPFKPLEEDIRENEAKLAAAKEGETK